MPHGGRNCYKGLPPPHGEDPQEMQSSTVYLTEGGGFQRLLPGEPEGGRRLGRGKGVVGEGWWASVAGRLSIHVPTPCSSLECVFYFKPGKSQLLA